MGNILDKFIDATVDFAEILLLDPPPLRINTFHRRSLSKPTILVEKPKTELQNMVEAALQPSVSTEKLNNELAPPQSLTAAPVERQSSTSRPPYSRGTSVDKIVSEQEATNWLLRMAIVRNQPEIVRFLVEEVNVEVNHGHLNLAASYGGSAALEVGRALLDAGASIDAKEVDKGGDLLQAAASFNNVRFIEMISDRFPDYAHQHVNDRDGKGDTALILAARKGQLEMVKFLAGTLEADVSLFNKAGKTALHEACIMGHESVVDFLLKTFPALRDARTQRPSKTHQETALELALFYDHQSIVDIFGGSEFESGRRIFQSFKHYMDIVNFEQASFAIFSPQDGHVSGPDGPMSWKGPAEEDRVAKLRGVIKMAVVALSGVFEEFMGEMLREAVKRETKQPVTSNKQSKFPPLFKSFREHWSNLFGKERGQRLDKAVGDFPYDRAAMFYRIRGLRSRPEMSVRVTLRRGKNALDCLDRLSRLLYGLRCLLAHSAQNRENSVLNGISFSANDFEGNQSVTGEMAEHFNDLVRRISAASGQKQGRRKLAIDYQDYVTMRRTYKLIACVLQSSVMETLGLWGENDRALFLDDLNDMSAPM